MNGLRKTLARLEALRRRFDDLVGAPAAAPPPAERAAAGAAARLHEVTGFGANPGNLRMWMHVPARLSKSPALVVALHGCGQTAAGYAQGTGWAALADRHGFVVVLPEQDTANNPKTCFTWFMASDITRGEGEVVSVQQMVDHAVHAHAIDRGRVFVTGLSAGGAMANALLATYPEVYAGGAIVAGLPYGCAEGVQQAFEAMFTDQTPSGRALVHRVRQASPHQGPWPRLSVWHGTADAIVKPSNAEHIVRQWAGVHDLAPVHTREDLVAGHRRRVWTDAAGAPLIETYTIAGMGHGVPLATSEDGVGAPGPYFFDVGLSSTHAIAQFFGLAQALPQAAAAPAGVTILPARPQRDASVRPDVAPGTAETGPQPLRRGPEAGRDPAGVIAAALQAAGLPLASPPAAKPGRPGAIDPAQIIDAALKASGLRKR
jgi:poly(hydroxyalkanoate) depolymerase family esterase